MPFPVDIQYIEKTEVILNVKFPDSFKLKMLQENGGEIEVDEDVWFIYPFFDESDKKRIKRTCNDLVRENEQAKLWTNFPEEAIAFANNGGGDQLVFVRNKLNQTLLDNAVYWWNHETGEITLLVNDFMAVSSD